MSNFFDINRFGKYLCYDMRRAYKSYGLSILSFGLVPVICFIFFELYNLIFSGHFFGFQYVGIITIATALIIAAMAIPTRLYGPVTDKRFGTDYLLLPVSTFEKWLSMMLILCVILPVVLFGLLFLSDSLLGWILPNLYTNILTHISSVDMIPEEISSMSFPLLFVLNWIHNLLFFNLGAIYFKKSKIAKSILVSLLLSMILTTFLSLGNNNILSIETFIKDNYSTAELALRSVSNFVLIFEALMIAVLMGLSYWRLKTIKQ